VSSIEEKTPDHGCDERVPEPARVDQIAGDLITETFEYDGGRKVTVYLPLSRPQAVVFSGDGQLISRWGEYLEAADVPPTMIVGAHRTGSEDEMVRLGEYAANVDAARFAAHERFFVHDVHAWIESRFGVTLPASRTVIAGVSASAELALAMVLRHPNLYGTVFAASPGAGYQPPSVMPSALPHAYLTAGTLEPFFLDNATRWVEALRAAGADVVMSERVGDHGDPFWKAEFVKMVSWAFGH
jgi:enterochelin esterase-like enzyme